MSPVSLYPSGEKKIDVKDHPDLPGHPFFTTQLPTNNQQVTHASMNPKNTEKFKGIPTK